MECTKGEWKIHQYVQEGIWEITAGSVCIASVSDEANANLIVEAVNACQSVNPNNPIATAKAIKDMHEACQGLIEHMTMPKNESGRPYLADVKRMAEKALAKASNNAAISK